MQPPRSLSALLLGDPDPSRFERSEALRLSLPDPRPEIPLSHWLPGSLPISTAVSDERLPQRLIDREDFLDL